jgi:hypothetical protein
MLSDFYRCPGGLREGADYIHHQRRLADVSGVSAYDQRVHKVLLYVKRSPTIVEQNAGRINVRNRN